jgi:hypothetical protein
VSGLGPLGEPLPEAPPLPPPPRRLRRRRALASALRWVVAQEPVPAPGAEAALAARLAAMAESQGSLVPEADLPELLARLQPGSLLPPEAVLMIAALLPPLLDLRAARPRAPGAGQPGSSVSGSVASTPSPAARSPRR